MDQHRFARTPQNIDRALIGTCAVVWLLVLGFSVAAGVALVDLGRGHPQNSAGDGDTPWLLYGVIAVSAVVIALAVPLLLRARNAGSRPCPAETPLTPRLERHQPGYPGTVTAGQAAQSAAAGSSAAALDRLLLRGGLGVLTAMGVGMVAVAIGTHLMAVDLNGAAWGLYGLAALATGAMVFIPEYLLRQLRSSAS